MKNKAGLMIGIFLLSVAYGFSNAFGGYDDFAHAIQVAIWLVLILLCVMFAVKLSHMTIGGIAVVRLLLALCINAFIFWEAPWMNLSALGSFAANEGGLILLLYIISWLSVLSMNLLLVLALLMTAGSLVKLSVVHVVRWLLFLSAAALVFMLATLFAMWLYSVLPSSLEWIYALLDGFITISSVGIALYFTTVMFSNAWLIEDEA